VGRSLKQLAALDRALRRRQEVRQPYQELLAKFRDTLPRIAEAVREAAYTFMEGHVGMLDKAVDQYLRDHKHPELLVHRLREFENDWPRTFASRIVTAVQGVSQDTLNSLR
jgi:dTDP-4-amino-4,6-dideoxygalactose transaminase